MMRSDIETTPDELEGIVKTLNEGFQTTIKKTLSPWIKKMSEESQQYAAVASVLKQLPEFQNLVAENAELRLELSNARNKIAELEKNAETSESVKLHVVEKNVLADNDETDRVASVYQDANIDQKSSENSPYSKPSFSRPSPVTSSTVTVEANKDDEEDDEDEDDVSEEEEDDEEEEEEEDDDEEEASVENVTAVANKWDKAEHDRVIQGEEEEDDDEEEEDGEESDEDPDVPKVPRTAAPEVKASEESGNDEDEEEEVFVVELEGADDPQYYTNDEENGNIYKILPDDDIGEKVGEFQDGEPVFFE